MAAGLYLVLPRTVLTGNIATWCNTSINRKGYAMNTYVIREMAVRPIEISLDRVATAANREAAVSMWCTATGEAEPYSVEELPPFAAMTKEQRHAMQLLERL
jgi:hypothetical protein